MIPRFRPSLSAGDLLRLAAASPVAPQEFEGAFASRYGFAHARWFPYARVGVVCYLESLGAAGKAVLSPFNCVALGNGIVRGGFEPLYVDTEPEGFNQDAGRFLEALDACAAVGVVVPLWGIRTELEGRGPYRKPVLYDFALRGLDPVKPRMGERDAVLYSLGWGKPVNGLGGAMLCTDDPGTAARWSEWQKRHLTMPPRRKPALSALVREVAFHPAVFGLAAYLFERWEVGSTLLGHADRENLLPSDWHALPSSAQRERTLESLGELDDAIRERARQVARYHDALRDIPAVDLPPAEPQLSHFAVRALARDAIVSGMRRRGVFCSSRLFDRLLCDYAWLRGETMGSLDRARTLTRETLHLPLYRGMTVRVQDRVIAALRETAFALREEPR